MSKLWQKVMLFAISLILGVVCMMQIRTTNNVLGNEDPQNIASQLDNELTELTLQKK